jgi:thiamine pyrophosphokinase
MVRGFQQLLPRNSILLITFLCCEGSATIALLSQFKFTCSKGASKEKKQKTEVQNLHWQLEK